MKPFWKIASLTLAVAACSALISYVTVERFARHMTTENASVQSCTEPQDPYDTGKKADVRLVSGEAAAPASAYPDFTQAAESSVQAVVHIMCKSTRSVQNQQMPIDLFEYFFGMRDYNTPRQPQTQVGYGSGVIISRDGYIVTNNHVIENADEIEVTLNDQRRYTAKLVGTDPTTDVALIKIEEDNLAVIPFGDSDRLKVGQWVLAIGNPLNLTSTVTAGIVSAKARNLGIIGSENPSSAGRNKMSIESFIQTDAAVNPGNSGGALVNTDGELVGINTAIVSSSGAFSGYSFAIPVSIVRKVVADLKEYGSVQRAMLGVTIISMSADLAKEKKIEMTEGVYVESVADHSGAKEAGVKAGDIITAVDGKKVASNSELQEMVSRFRPGDKVTLTLLRDKKSETLEVTLRNSQGNTEVVKNVGMEALGAAFGEVSAQTKKQLGISYGIQVTGLTDGKLKDAGMRKGFIILKVNDQKIHSVNELETMVSDVRADGGFAETGLFIVGIYPTGKVTYYAIDLAE